MAETAGTQIIRVLPPGVKRTGPANEKIMRIGWRAVADGLLAPKSALRCDVLHVAGDPPRDAEPLAAAIAEECRRTGAEAVFFEFPERAQATAIEAAGALREAFGLTAYSTFTGGGLIATVPDTQPSPPEPPFALCVAFRSTLTEISGKNAEKRCVTRGELHEIIQRHAPQITFSQELSANYFTLHADGKTLFAVFDTDETIRLRIDRARAGGACACFV